MRFQNSILAQPKILNARSMESEGVLSPIGVRNKTLICLGLASIFAIMGSAIASKFSSFSIQNQSTSSTPLVMGGIIVAITIALGIYNAFNMSRPNPIAIMLYCSFEGLLLGFISFAYEFEYKGIVLQAVLATGAIAWVSAFLASKLSETGHSKIRKFLTIAVPAYVLFIFINFIVSLFIKGAGVFSTPLGLIVSSIAIIIGSLLLINDFGNVSILNGQAPKNMEWSVAYAITLDIIWIFLEVLRLLAQLNRR